MVKTFKIIIAGGRDFNDYNLLKSYCKHVLQNKSNIEIVSGTAKGADELGEKFAIENNLGLKSFPASWNDIEGKPESQIGTRADGKKYWKVAGHFRNEEMVKYSDVAVIFHDGISTGSLNMVQQMKKLGKPVRIIKY